MMITYLTETHEKCVRGRTMTVVNLTPALSECDKRAAKKVIEQQLYDVFSKYTQTNA